MMKKLFLVFTFGVILINTSFGQNYYEEVRDSVPEENRVYFGGNLSANIFGRSKFIDISPYVGYRFTPQISAGLGGSYQYLEREYIFSNQNRFKLSSTLYGARVFGQYRINEMYYAHTELESLNVELGTGVGNETRREWVPGFFIGGGVLTPFFANGAINLTVLYNLTHDRFKSPYGSPWVIRGGVVF